MYLLYLMLIGEKERTQGLTWRQTHQEPDQQGRVVGSKVTMIYIQEQYKQVEQACLELDSQRLEFCKISHSHFLLSLSTFCIVPPLLSYLRLSSEEQLQVHWSFVLLLKMKWNMTNYYLFNSPSSHKKYLSYFFLRIDKRTQR